MLESVHIADFRSCHDVTIDKIGRLVALVGRNSAGKTNILRAIEWGAQTAVAKQAIKWDRPSDAGFGAEIQLVFMLDGTRYRYTTKVGSIHQREGAPLEVKFRLEETLSTASNGDNWETLVNRDDAQINLFVDSKWQQLRTNVNTPCLPILGSFVPETDIMPHVERVLRYLETIRYYPLDEMSQPLPTDPSQGVIVHTNYLQWLAGYRDSPDPNAPVVYRLLDMWLERREDFQELKSLVGPNGLGLIDNIDIKAIFNKADKISVGDTDLDKEDIILYWMTFAPSTQQKPISRSFSLAELSYGARRVLRMLVSMLYDNSAVLLVEQPEDAIHPGLLHKLIPLIRDYADGRQFIFASHSPEVFNRLQPDEIRLVAIKDGQTYVRALSKSELESAKRFMGEDGTLSDFIESIGEE